MYKRQVLVCTTLIETGVDVRNCNTLIIENADRMGLCLLYTSSNIVIIAAAGNTAGTHATCNNSCVAGHAAADGQDLSLIHI